MAEPLADAGQVDNADSPGATAPAPSASDGQSATPDQTTVSGSDSGVETFFDPKTLEGKPELQSAYRQMQGSYTKKMQAIREAQNKVDMYDQFAANPVESAKQLLQQYGMSVISGDPPQGDTEFNPNSWDDVTKHIRDQLIQEMGPVFNEVKSLKKQNVESFLDSNHPDWRTYEDEMIGALKDHPTLANNPSALYKLAVPEKILEQRATNAALSKLKGSSDAASVSSPGTTRQSNPQAPSGPMSFQQAVDYAKAQLASKGLKAG